MRTGLWVLCVFSAVWGAVALFSVGAPAWTWPAPPLISLAIALWAAPRTFASSDRAPAERKRVGRLVALWSGLAGAAALVAVNLLPASGHARLIGNAVALIVASHFLPLAKGLPYRPYYVTGVLMIATSVATAWLPGREAQAASAACASLILWATMLGFPRTATVATLRA